jgi:hypothetical protein
VYFVYPSRTRLQYLHVQLVAKELPPLEFVHEVGRAANSFWAANSDHYIAIHCAYGEQAAGAGLNYIKCGCVVLCD